MSKTITGKISRAKEFTGNISRAKEIVGTITRAKEVVGTIDRPDPYIDADAASILLTGTAANLEYNRLVGAGSGAYSHTGTAATILYDRVLTANSGTYTFTGQDATLTHNTSSWETGQALRYDGANDWVSLASSDTLTGAFTVAFWCTYDGGTRRSIIATGSGGTDSMYFWNSGLFIVRIASSEANFTTPSTQSNGWHSFVITRDGSNNVRCYIDGTESVTGAVVKSGTFTYDAFGRWNTSFLHDGDVDDIAIYDGTTWTATNASDFHNSGTPVDPESIVGSATHIYYHNGSGSDTTLTDEKGANDGTLNNFTLPGAWITR